MSRFVTADEIESVTAHEVINTITLELTYILVEIGGVVMLELDKLNSIYKVKGVDLLAEIRNQC